MGGEGGIEDWQHKWDEAEEGEGGEEFLGCGCGGCHIKCLYLCVFEILKNNKMAL